MREHRTFKFIPCQFILGEFASILSLILDRDFGGAISLRMLESCHAKLVTLSLVFCSMPSS